MRNAVAALALGLLAWPSDAEACDPFVGVHAVFPSDGTTLPVNGIVVASGVLFEPSELVGFVDGEQVELEVVERVSGENGIGWGTAVGVRAVELPLVGSTLEVRYCPPIGGCEVLGMWTLGEADHEAPSPPTLAQLDYMERTGCGVSSCAPSTVDRIGYLRVEAPEDEPRLVSIRLRNTQGASVELYMRVAHELPAETAFALNDLMSPGAAPEDTACVEVRLFDLAGNEAPYGLDTCSPCHVGFDPVAAACVPYEVEWTDADLFPGGDCVGTPIDPLPALPDPLEPRGGSTGSSTSGAIDTTSGGTSGGGPGGEGTSGEATTGGVQTTGTTAPSGSSGPAQPDDEPPTGDAHSSSSSAGQTEPSTEGGGCRAGGTTAPGWLALLLAPIFGRRRRTRRR